MIITDQPKIAGDNAISFSPAIRLCAEYNLGIAVKPQFILRDRLGYIDLVGSTINEIDDQTVPSLC